MWRNPKLRRRVLEVLGLIALILIILTSIVGAVFTEGLTITISQISAPAHLVMTGTWAQAGVSALSPAGLVVPAI